MKLRKQIELEVKQTIGYLEAENKQSFMVGVGVGISKIEEHYKIEIETLKRQLEEYKFSFENAEKYFEEYKSRFEKVEKDLKTLACIINRYSDDGL